MFRFYHRQLSKLGVQSVNEFKSVIRASQARALRQRQREKSAAKSGNKTPQKNGIINTMKNATRTAVALSLAIAGAVALPLRSDEFSRKSLTSPPSLPRSVLHAA